VIELPWPAKELNPNVKCHWSKKAKAAKAYKEVSYYLTKKHEKPKFKEGPIWLEVLFVPPDKRRRDQDNLIASIKSLLDGVALAWEVDDSRFTGTYTLCPPEKKGKVVICISTP